MSNSISIPTDFYNIDKIVTCQKSKVLDQKSLWLVVLTVNTILHCLKKIRSNYCWNLQIELISFNIIASKIT